MKMPQVIKMELVSNPTIKVKELQERRSNGTMGQLEIHDTVSGKRTTLDQCFDEINHCMEKSKIPKGQRRNFWKNVKGVIQ